MSFKDLEPLQQRYHHQLVCALLSVALRERFTINLAKLDQEIFKRKGILFNPENSKPNPFQDNYSKKEEKQNHE